MKTSKQNLDEELNIIEVKSQTVFNRLDTIRESSKGKNRIFISQEEFDLLYDAAVKLKESAGWAQHYNKQLYKNRGKGTSIKKKAASVENGKKGGRPPKEITIARRRVGEIEDLRFSDIKITDEMKTEHDELVRKIHAWEDSKGIIWSYWEGGV